MREAIAGGLMMVCWVASTDNLADLCTKILYGQTLKNLVDRLMVDYNFGTLKEKMKKEEWLFYMFNKSRDLRYDDPQ